VARVEIERDRVGVDRFVVPPVARERQAQEVMRRERIQRGRRRLLQRRDRRRVITAVVRRDPLVQQPECILADIDRLARERVTRSPCRDHARDADGFETHPTSLGHSAFSYKLRARKLRPLFRRRR
jgi:hypothetical protein